MFAAVCCWKTRPLHGDVYSLFHPLSGAGLINGISMSAQTTGYLTGSFAMAASAHFACCVPQAVAVATVAGFLFPFRGAPGPPPSPLATAPPPHPPRPLC